MNQIPATPLMLRWQQLKAESPGKLVCIRIGSFYELFGDDAKTAAKVLKIALTARNGVPMCGFPFHCMVQFTGQLTQAGHPVSLWETAA